MITETIEQYVPIECQCCDDKVSVEFLLENDGECAHCRSRIASKEDFEAMKETAMEAQREGFTCIKKMTRLDNFPTVPVDVNDILPNLLDVVFGLADDDCHTVVTNMRSICNESKINLDFIPLTFTKEQDRAMIKLVVKDLFDRERFENVWSKVI